MLRRRPALRIVILFAGGILLARLFPLMPLIVLPFAVLSVLLSVLSLWKEDWQLPGSVLLQIAVIFLGFLLQTVEHSGFESRRLNPETENEPAVVWGRVDSDVIERNGKLQFILNTDSISRRQGLAVGPGRIMILVKLARTDPDSSRPETGNELRIKGTIERFPYQRNPGEFDYGKYLELNEIAGIIYSDGLEKVKNAAGPGEKSAGSFVYSIQRKLFGIIDTLHSARHSGFLKGIIFGYRQEIPSDVKEAFIDTGTIHILAVSGSNVAFIAFMLFSVLGLLRLPKKAVVLVSAAGLIMYMLITGSSASVVRATIMAIVILLGTALERKTDIYNSISVAALILLLWNTNTLFDVGFQLSFAAVISIVYFYPFFDNGIKKITGKFEEFKSVDIVLKLLAVSLAAQIGTLPFTAYYFGRVSIISLIANIPVVPISGLNTLIGFTEIVFHFFSPRIAGLYATANDFLIWFLLGFIKRASELPFAYFRTSNLNILAAAGYYAAVLVIFNIDRRNVRIWMLICILIFCNYFVYKEIFSRPSRKLTLTMIDVGQGDALLVEFPDHKCMLIDSGPSTSEFNAGERIIVPFLKYKGITRLNYFIVTHPHSDHIGGAAAVMREIQVDTLIFNSPDYESRGVRDVMGEVYAGRCVMSERFIGSTLPVHPDVRVYILHPDSIWNSAPSINNRSIVIRVQYGRSTALFCGDAEIAAEKRITGRYAKMLASEILKVGHHGSSSGTGEEFLHAVHPSQALISVGRRNRFGHPSPFTIGRLARDSVKVRRTDRNGAVVLETDGEEWNELDWRRGI